MTGNDNLPSASAIDRREVLKRAARVAGVAAFATPVVAGVFGAPAMAQAVCSPEGDSDVVFAEVTPGSVWNQNCSLEEERARGPGHYNGQDHDIVIADGTGQVQVGNRGNDNFRTDISFYRVLAIGYTCNAVFSYQTCAVQTQMSRPDLNPEAPDGALPLPYCPGACGGVGNSPNGLLVLETVVCCPI